MKSNSTISSTVLRDIREYSEYNRGLVFYVSKRMWRESADYFILNEDGVWLVKEVTQYKVR